MISADNLIKSFADQLLFDGISFKINSRERVGLVGRNGHGKTTLFRILVGEAHPDSGVIVIPSGYRIGYVHQEIEFMETTVLKEGMRGLPENERTHHWKVEKILSGLGFSDQDFHRSPHEFSGGFQVRLNLAKVLVSDPDLLLLDEPTNYLDIASIRWIERFLLSWPHEVMLITHDRTFMDRIVTHVMGIHRRKLRKVKGDTEKYYSQIADEEEIYEKTRKNDARRQKDTELFISRFRAKARLANLVQSRIKTLQKMQKRNPLEKIKTLDFSFSSKPFKGKYVLHAQNVSFGYPTTAPLIRNFSLSVGAHDRIFVVGRNGKGKTTLLKILAGLLALHEGETILSPGAATGYFEQTNTKNLNNNKTVEEEILSAQSSHDRQQARNICGAMMFESDSALKKIEILSGGEKSRVLLGQLLVTPCNLLLLDEPTNHLDMESCDALLAALDSFDGAVIMVTHNEMYLHALAERLVVFQDDRVYPFEGTYQQFLEAGGWRDEEPTLGVTPKSETTKRVEKPTKKDMRRRRSDIISERSKALRPLELRMVQTENEIETNEREIASLTEALEKALTRKDALEIVELSQSIHNRQKLIECLFQELESLMETLENKRARFDQRLKECESQNV
ncbi:MAG: ATP-binding cassette domain-containing protein [Deltaproteobacteria bacterium]|nr:ATP-binding cassette domain-containing protein [Deltaproteobacteria bacterium]